MFDRFIANSVSHWSRVFGVAIDPALVRAIIQHESIGGTVLSTSESRGRMSYGPMMVLDSTARGMGVQDPASLKDPGLGIWYGVRNLGELLRQFSGDVERAVSAYNTGPSRATRSASGAFPNQSYVDKVMGYYRTFRGAALPAFGALALVAVIAFGLKRRRAA
jgi:soluble lytic murein transglycosylase-like protein